MKWFLDTEFYERPGSIDLISIGLVGSDGREVYAENADFDWAAVPADHWLQENVRPHLLGDTWLSPRQEIAELVLANVGNKPEFYGWYSDYDWVVFCWLFGAMGDLPDGFPMYCHDLRQRVSELHIDPESVPPQDGTEHNALEDARWNKRVYEHLQAAAPVLCAPLETALEEAEDRFESCDNCERPSREEDLKVVWCREPESGEQVDARICLVCRLEVERDQAAQQERERVKEALLGEAVKAVDRQTFMAFEGIVAAALITLDKEMN